MSKRRPSIQTAIKSRIPKGARILVALSGGRDSIALTDALLRLKRLLSIKVEACHIDHGLRASSVNDAEFVKGWCADRGLECHIVKLTQRPARENIEAWARRERYAALKTALLERGLDTLCTAHTANDVAETLLMRLFANKELNTILESDARRSLIRPLIEVTREQIDSYVEGYGLSFIEDPTNIDTGFVRNRVRHEVLPLLRERFDPSIVWILSERARSLASDVAALDSLASECLGVLAPLELGSAIWLERCRCELSAQPDAIKWRVVQGLLLPLVGFTVGEDKALAVVRIFLEGVAGAVQLSKDLRLRIVAGARKRKDVGGVFLEGG